MTCSLSTDYVQFARCTGRMRLAVAILQNTDAGESEIVFHGIAGLELCESPSDLQRGGLRNRFIVVETQDATEPAHVNVHRHDQLGLVDALP